MNWLRKLTGTELVDPINSEIGYQNTGGQFYDALKNKGRRRDLPPPKVRHSENKLKDRDRRQIIAKTQDVTDNFALAGWMVRTYLNYSAALSFQSKTGRKGLDDQVEAFMASWSNRFACDAQRRHPLRRLIRMMEAQRQCAGDVFILKIGRGPLRGSIQLIESPRVANPTSEQSGSTAYQVPSNSSPTTQGKFQEWFDGVKVNKAGAAVSYAVHAVDADGGLVFEREVSPRNMLIHACYERPDQVRGKSPFIPALNSIQDLYEGFDYVQAKQKIDALFAAFITRDADMGLDPESTDFATNDLDLSAGPKIFDLNPGEGVQMIQSQTPQSNSLEFMRLMVQVVMKALDLPYSFFSEDFTNFAGSRGASIQFKKAIQPKQQDIIETLDELTRWRLGMAVADGDIELPRNMEFDDLMWEWVPDGTPFWDPIKEVSAAKAAVSGGFTTPQRVAKELGHDFEDDIRAIADANKIAERYGVVLDYSMSTSSSTAVTEPLIGVPEEPEPDESSEDDMNEPEEEQEDDNTQVSN